MDLALDRLAQAPVPGRVELDLVDAVAVAVVRAQARLVALGSLGVLDRLDAAGQLARVAQPVDSPAAALALERLAQRQVRVEDVVGRDRRRLVEHVVGGARGEHCREVCQGDQRSSPIAASIRRALRVQLNSAARSLPGGAEPVVLGAARAQQRVGEGAGVVGVREQRGVAADLGQGGAVRGHHRRAARHRLEGRQAEALVDGRHRERAGAGVQAGQEPLRHVPEPAPGRRRFGVHVGAARARRHELDAELREPLCRGRSARRRSCARCAWTAQARRGARGRVLLPPGRDPRWARSSPPRRSGRPRSRRRAAPRSLGARTRTP